MREVKFALLDSQGNPAVLEANNPGTFILRLTNNTSSAISLAGGLPCRESDAGENGDVAARWYLNCPLSISNEIIAELTITAAGWTATPYTSRGRNLWGLVRDEPGGNLEANQSIDFTITSLTVSDPTATSAAFTVDVYHIGVPSTEAPFCANVAPNPSQNVLSAEIDPPVIYL